MNHQNVISRIRFFIRNNEFDSLAELLRDWNLNNGERTLEGINDVGQAGELILNALIRNAEACRNEDLLVEIFDRLIELGADPCRLTQVKKESPRISVFFFFFFFFFFSFFLFLYFYPSKKRDLSDPRSLFLRGIALAANSLFFFFYDYGFTQILRATTIQLFITPPCLASRESVRHLFNTDAARLVLLWNISPFSLLVAALLFVISFFSTMHSSMQLR